MNQHISVLTDTMLINLPEEEPCPKCPLSGPHYQYDCAVASHLEWCDDPCCQHWAHDDNE